MDGDVASPYLFHLVDYLVFGAMLVACAGAGVYYGVKDRLCKKDVTSVLSEFVSGSGKLKPFPVAMSLISR